MIFLLQKEKNAVELDIDLMTLKQELQKQKFQHEFSFACIDDFKEKKQLSNKIDMKEVVPVGDLNYIQEYLSNYHGINNMSPIEVPPEMRLDKFLNRKYSIITKDELLTKKGYYFTKYASKLKEFSNIGPVECLTYIDEGKKPFLKDGLYVFSEVKEIFSEYRCFVYRDEIVGIQYYDGDPTIMPTPDEILKIKEMVLRYTVNNTRPGAYSLDMAIIMKNNEVYRDIMVLELHPHTSLGLYGYIGSSLPYQYRLGLDWYIKNNTNLLPFNNFKQQKASIF